MMAIFEKKKLQKMKAMERRGKKHILMIVDDEEAHLHSREALFSEDYYILTSQDGQEVLAYIQKMDNPGKIGLIISYQNKEKGGTKWVI